MVNMRFNLEVSQGITVGDNRLFSLLDLQEHFQLESQTDDYEYYDCEYDFIYVNGTFFSNLPVNGHTIYNTDYQDGDVTLSVLEGGINSMVNMRSNLEVSQG